MTLSNYEFDTVFSIDSRYVNVLVVEDEKKFYEYCKSIIDQIDGADGSFTISEGVKTLAFSKCAFLIDIFNFDVNDKKIVLKFQHHLVKLIVEKYCIEMDEINQKWSTLFQKLNSECDCEIDYDPENVSSVLLKSFDVKFSTEDGSLLNRLITYIKIVACYLRIRCFFFINLKTMMTECDLKELYYHAGLEDVSLFLLENREKPIIDGEKILLIDRDLCEIKIR